MRSFIIIICLFSLSVSVFPQDVSKKKIKENTVSAFEKKEASPHVSLFDEILPLLENKTVNWNNLSVISKQLDAKLIDLENNIIDCATFINVIYNSIDWRFYRLNTALKGPAAPVRLYMVKHVDEINNAADNVIPRELMDLVEPGQREAFKMAWKETDPGNVLLKEFYLVCIRKVKKIISEKIKAMPHKTSFDLSHFHESDIDLMEHFNKKGWALPPFEDDEMIEGKKTLAFLLSPADPKESFMLTFLYCKSHISYYLNRRLDYVLKIIKEKEGDCHDIVYFYYIILKTKGADPMVLKHVNPMYPYGHAFGTVKFHGRYYLFDESSFLGNNSFVELLNSLDPEPLVTLEKIDADSVLKNGKPGPFFRPKPLSSKEWYKLEPK